jgi:fused signal recognition particle receptor
MGNSEGKPGFWGTTLGRLKSVLAKTKDQVGLDEVLAEGTQAAEQAAGDQTTAEQTAAPQTVPTAAVGAAATAPTATGAVESTVDRPAERPAATKQAERPADRPPPAPPKQRAASIVDEDFIESLQDRLIRADLGLGNVEALIGDLKRESKAKNWNSHDVENFLKKEFGQLLTTTKGTTLNFKAGALNVYLVVGVNGVGKTTSIGKLAWRFKSEGKKVLLAAGDTFRAAAESQLEIWSQRADVDIVRLPDGSDPGAVVYQALAKARAEQYDVVIIDTAGRLHNKTNLMAELKKIRSVVDKQKGDADVESLLVLDASTGQNGLQQAKVFSETCGLTGVILTKLDGTAKGGVVFAIARELKIPVKLIGIGEKVEDLRDFDADMFVEALF